VALASRMPCCLLAGGAKPRISEATYLLDGEYHEMPPKKRLRHKMSPQQAWFWHISGQYMKARQTNMAQFHKIFALQMAANRKKNGAEVLCAWLVSCQIAHRQEYSLLMTFAE